VPCVSRLWAVAVAGGDGSVAAAWLVVAGNMQALLSHACLFSTLFVCVFKMLLSSAL
jgi:hypothetical protein